jgi:hypothetical protein
MAMSLKELPPPYALVEFNQKFYPFRLWSPIEAELVYLSPIDDNCIPPAIRPFARAKRKYSEGYVRRADAIKVCHERAEQAALIKQWEVLAAQQETHPERNSWYLDEIARMTGEVPHTVQLDTFACASTHVTLAEKCHFISGEGWTTGEALEALCARVYELMKPEGVAQPITFHTALSM